MIKAPFNFVPLSQKVFFPDSDWAEQVSQDIPFEDGLSGTLDLCITSNSPIFIRNGHTRNDKELVSETYLSSAKLPNGQYYIPATSLKGAIRNVFEILTASKVQLIQNQSFGIRELSGGDSAFYRDKIKPEQIHCGWLRCENETYLLDDCDLPGRISLEEIDSKLGIGLEDFAKNGDFKNDSARTALAKYEMAEGADLHAYFEDDEELRSKLKVGDRQFVKFSHGGFGGTIVFTGQPGNRKQNGKQKQNGERGWTGKYFEFVFPDAVVNSNITLSDFLVNSFLSIHKNSPDFKDFWKKKLAEGEKIPVFFTIDEDGNPEAMGLSYMFKYPAYNSIINALRRDDLKTKKLDMTECVFGKVDGDTSLKGRVMFRNAICTTAVNKPEKKSFILSSPHPSYYPLYLGKGQTWNSESIQIAGRKRYPVRDTVAPSTVGTKEMENAMRPLPQGLQFFGKVMFFNLKPVELGALIAALTFNGKSTCHHSIGAGKPYGLGKCKIDILGMNLSHNDESHVSISVDDLLHVYNDMLIDYQDNNALNELYAMAEGIPAGREKEFTYMQMSTNAKNNEFVDGKKEYAQGVQLGKFTDIISHSVPKTYLVGNVASNKKRIDIEEIIRLEEEARLEEETKRKALQEKEDAYAVLLSDAIAAEESGDYLTAIAKATEAHTMFENRPEPDYIIVRNRSLQTQKELAEQKANSEAAINAARTGKYGKPLAEVLATTKYISQELSKWCKVNVNRFGDDEYNVLFGILKEMDAKQLRVAIKSKKDVEKAIPDYAKRLFEELGLK